MRSVPMRWLRLSLTDQPGQSVGSCQCSASSVSPNVAIDAQTASSNSMTGSLTGRTLLGLALHRPGDLGALQEQQADNVAVVVLGPRIGARREVEEVVLRSLVGN